MREGSSQRRQVPGRGRVKDPASTRVKVSLESVGWTGEVRLALPRRMRKLRGLRRLVLWRARREMVAGAAMVRSQATRLAGFFQLVR